MSNISIPSTYIIDGDKILVADSPANTEIHPLNVTAATFSLPMPHSDLPVAQQQIQYQINGIVRLNPDLHQAHTQTMNSVDFAMSKDIAVQLGIITELTNKMDVSKNNTLDNQLYQSPLYEDKTHQTYRFVSFRVFLTTLPPALLDHLSQAIQRLRWHMEHQFCCQCGSETKAHDILPAMVCIACGYTQYTQVQPCVITAIQRANPYNGKQQILLAQHRNHRNTESNSPMYGLIAGFVEVGESLEHAVHRETQEEVGLKVSNLQYFASQPWPYPSNLMVGFIADYAEGDIILQEDELVHADFFDIDNLPIIPPVGTIARALINHITTKI